MADQRLRDLERDATHGDLQARARLLRERLRVGDLAEERLRLAAYLGDEAARSACGDAAAVFVLTLPDEPTDVTVSERTHGEWVRQLLALGGRAGLARAVVAGLRVADQRRGLLASGASYSRSLFRQALDDLEAWAARFDEASLERCRRHADGDDWFERAAARIAVCGDDEVVFNVMAVFSACAMGPGGRPAGVGPMQAAIVAALVPWALAPGDPSA